MRKCLHNRAITQILLDRGARRHPRRLSWRAILECGHQTWIATKYKRPLTRAELDLVVKGHPYEKTHTNQDYETGREYTYTQTYYQPASDDQILEFLLPPPKSWGCRQCPRHGPGSPNVLFRLAHAHRLASRCRKHGALDCTVCGQPSQST